MIVAELVADLIPALCTDTEVTATHKSMIRTLGLAHGALAAALGLFLRGLGLFLRGLGLFLRGLGLLLRSAQLMVLGAQLIKLGAQHMVLGAQLLVLVAQLIIIIVCKSGSPVQFKLQKGHHFLLIAHMPDGLRFCHGLAINKNHGLNEPFEDFINLVFVIPDHKSPIPDATQKSHMVLGIEMAVVPHTRHISEQTLKVFLA